ncbi:hypothetical protein M758_8G181700 [Ceratodon purpureus]|nr:hypothetical protein M758_8G181700 [Ceratodon purpureus]
MGRPGRQTETVKYRPGRQSETLKNSYTSAEVDYLNLCEEDVRSIENVVDGGNLLNERQCVELSSKLSKTTKNIRELVLHCGVSTAPYRPALENLFRHVEKAKWLVNKCSEEDWCVASVFQIQNENAFREILLDVSLCYQAIYEEARSTCEEQSAFPDDLRQSSVFIPSSPSDVDDDRVILQKRLEDVACEDGEARNQCLARYLLVKLKYAFDPSQAETLDTSSAILWTKQNAASEIWGSDRFLGSGSGGTGVCSTKWMEIPCARKVFLKADEASFLKESGILARLKHPRIVNFICCGNGEQSGDCFIAMELLEKSLFDLIEDQKGVRFSLPVVVDILLQIARGMCYLHDQGVAHRDLKPQNVVVNRLSFPHLVDHFDVKLVDFGISKTKVQVSKSNTISIPGMGTTHYRALEVHPKANPNRKGKAAWVKADVFSYAMTSAHVLTLIKPFGDLNASELYEALIGGRRPELPGDCPEELFALLRDCWNTSPQLRPSFREICTRLEALRYQILRGFPSSESSNARRQRCSITGYGSNAAESMDVSFVQRLAVAFRGGEVERVKNLLWIKSDAVCNGTLEELEHQEKLLSSRLDEKAKRRGNLKDEIYSYCQQTWGLWVFLGVVLTAVSQLAQIAQSQDGNYTCKKAWRQVIAIVALAWVVTGTVLVIWQRLRSFESLERERAVVDQARREKLLGGREDKLKRIRDLEFEFHRNLMFYHLLQVCVETPFQDAPESCSGDGILTAKICDVLWQKVPWEELLCDMLWLAVITVAVIWYVAADRGWRILSRIETLERELANEDQARREVGRRANALRREGEQFKFIEFMVEHIRKRVGSKAFLGHGIWNFWIMRFGGYFIFMSLFTGMVIDSQLSAFYNHRLSPIA